MNRKKIISFVSVGICALMAVFAVGINVASANVTGDLPGGDSPAFYIAAFSDPQDSPCDGTPDGGETLYAEQDDVSGDAIYNDNNDYTLTFSDVDATTSIYFCQKSTGNILANIVIDHDEGAGNHIVELGRVTGNGLHADVDGDYVIVCDGATKLTTVDKQIAVNTYSQFYAMDEQDADYLATRVYFVDAAADTCTFDEDMSTGKIITTITSLPDNYGIYTSFSPDTKAVGDMHADLDAAQMFLYDSGGYNIGLGIESYTRAGAPDGGVGDDDYTLYYDKPTSGDMELAIISTANGTTTVTEIDKDSFTAGYDFVNDVTDTGTGVPDDIAAITTTMTVGADSVVFTTTLHDTYLYDLYTDIDGAAQTILFEEPAGITVFQKDIDSSAEGDDTIDVGKVSGSAHADASTDGDDLFEVFSDATCTTEVSSTDAFGATAAYEAYFEDTGIAGFWIKMTQDSGGTAYDSCGNYFTLTNQAATQNLDRKITVVLPTAAIGADTADTILIDFDQGGTWTAATDVWSRDIESGTAILYTVNGDATDDIVIANDGDADPTNGLGTTLLIVTKDFSAVDVALDVGGVEGDTHGDLNDEAGDRVSVYSDNACTTTLVSSATVVPAAASDPDYGIFYEADGGATNYYAKFVDASGATACVKFGGDAGADTVLSPEYKLTTTLTAGNDATGDQINSIAIDNDKDAAWDAFANNADAAGTNVAYSVSDVDSDVYAYYDADATGTVVFLKTTGVNLSADETVDIAAISGDLDDDFIAATASGAVADDAAGLIAVYTDWDNNDTPTGLSNSHYVVDEAATDTYAVYLDVTAGAIAIGGADIKVKDQNDLVSWTMDRDDGGTTIAAGESVDIDLVIKVSGDTPVGTDHINIVGTADTTTHLAAGVADAVTGLYAIYTIAHDPGALQTIQGIAQEPKNAVADTNAVLIRDLTVVATPLADVTYDVAMFSGTNHADLDAGTVIVYSGADCTTAVSSETVNPAAGVWAQYFQGSDSTTYYTKIETAAGGLATCRILGDALAGATQAVADIDFSRKISGTVKDTSDGGTDVLSAAAMVTGAADNYFSDTVDGGATTYQMYVDSTLAGAGDTVRFYSAASAGGTMLLELIKDLSGDASVDVSAAYGETHADIEGGANLVNAVCSDHSASNVTCATKYSSEPQTPTAAGGADYEIFFEQQVGTTYYLEVLDEDTEDYYSWNKFTSGAAGTYANVELDGKFSGFVAELWDTPATRVPDVTIKMYTNGLDPETNQISLTYSYTGTTDPGGNYRMYGNATDTNDAQYIKDAYITQSAVDTGVLSNIVNIDLVSGVKIIIREFNSNQLITNATVSLYACAGATVDTCTAVLDTCTQPAGPCTRTGTGVAGNGLAGEYYFSGIPTGDYVQIRINKSGYAMIMDPNPVEATNASYQISAATVQPNGLATPSTYFLTPVAYDDTIPTVEQFYPADGSTGASINTVIALLFDEMMDTTTFTAANVELYKTSDLGTPIALDAVVGNSYFTIEGVPKTELIVYPTAALDYSTEYTLVVSGALTDMAGNAFAGLVANDFTFTTAAQVTGNLGIDYPIIAIKQTGTPDNTYGNGFEWVMRVTLPTNQPNIALQFANWTNGLNAANNMQYYSEQILAGAGSAASPVNITAASTYPTAVLVGIDADATRDGIQTDIHIKLKIPAATPAGAHYTTFKVQSTP